MKSSFEMLFALPQGIFCIDREYRIVFWNQLIEFWTGIKQDEILNKNAKEIFPELEKKFYKLMIHQVFEVGSTAIFSYQLHKNLFQFEHNRNGKLCIQSQVVRSHSPENTDDWIAVFSLQDISGLISQIDENKKVNDKVLALLEKMKVTEEELKVSNEELQKAASTDPLTGLSNRRHMMQILEDEERRHKRYGTVFSILLTDIDGFKGFNDKFGHACGDYILSHLGELFHNIIRPTDSVCRWGGEEFLFLLPETDESEAKIMAERLRVAIEKEDFLFDKINHSVTMTFGAGSITEESALVRTIDNADEALYYGKKNGKNRVVLHSEIINQT